MMSEHKPEELNWKGKRTTVLGLAREGTALVRFLAQQGAVVTATDLKRAEELRPSLDRLAGLPVRYCLGGHPEEVLECDVLFVSPGVPLDAPIVVEARRRRLLLSSESRLFCHLCPAVVAGVTGSSGKTTTATLVAEMVAASGKRVHLGGNIGSPLIARMGQIRPGDTVVTELSSFQLDFFGDAMDAEPRGNLASPLFPSGGWSPPVAAVLNVTPNHLDRHPTMKDYVAAKFKILRHQRTRDHAVLGWDDSIARSFAQDCRGQVAFFSVNGPVERGAFLKDDSLVLRPVDGESVVCSIAEVRLRGMHNVANILAACVISDLLGATRQGMAEVIRTFTGVEHRLEPVREWKDVWYYNDSIATSPERAMAGLQSFDEPIVLLAGGRDKHLPWHDWAELVSHKAVSVITFGEAAALIERVLGELGRASPPVNRAGDLAEAVACAEKVAQPGHVVLFSPGGTSFDAFSSFAERGEAFKRMVDSLGSTAGAEQKKDNEGQR
jgi:UDP-N-acetylmuramoylalanine--D-glutamate ligase